MIYVFRDSDSIFRLAPLLFLLVIGYQLANLVSTFKPMLDNLFYTKPGTYSIDELPKLASLKLNSNTSKLEIRQIFRFGEKSMIGNVVILLASIAFISLALIKTDDLSSQIGIVVIGLPLLIMSFLMMLRQFVDGIVIIGNEINISYNLRKNKVIFDQRARVKMVIEKDSVRNSDFITVSHYLQSETEWMPILSYQMDVSNSKDAIRLGKEIKRLIIERLEFNLTGRNELK